jgi:hypothetical protein
MLIILARRGWTFVKGRSEGQALLQSYDVFVPDQVTDRVAEAEVERFCSRGGDLLCRLVLFPLV